MFDEPLPKQADLRKYANKQACFKANLAVSSMSRFAEAVVEGQGLIKAELQFGVDEQRIRFIKGSADCETQVVCQRCMQPVDINISADVHLGIVWDEEDGKQLPRSMDSLIVGEDELVDLNEVLEEELLLSMPFVSYHEPGECSGKQSYESATDVEETIVEEKENPFSVLEQLKADK